MEFKFQKLGFLGKLGVLGRITNQHGLFALCDLFGLDKEKE